MLFVIIVIRIKKRILINNNETPLHYAVEKNDSIKIGELLISKGANINEKNIIYLNIISSFLIIINKFK